MVIFIIKYLYFCFTGMKQIQWEANRNRWIKGYNKALGKKENKKGQPKSFKRQLSHKNSHGNNSKKKKRF